MSELEKPTESGSPKKRIAKKKPAAKKKAPSRRASSGKKPAARAKKTKSPRSISAEERIRMISEAAYYRAEQREFRDGDPERDWLEAEAEVDALLLRDRSGTE